MTDIYGSMPALAAASAWLDNKAAENAIAASPMYTMAVLSRPLRKASNESAKAAKQSNDPADAITYGLVKRLSRRGSSSPLAIHAAFLLRNAAAPAKTCASKSTGAAVPITTQNASCLKPSMTQKCAA